MRNKLNQQTLLLFPFLCVYLSIFGQSNKYFKQFSNETYPTEVGKKVTERFIITPHTFFGTARLGMIATFITYPDVCTWYGAFNFAAVTGDKILTNKLLEKVSLLLKEEASLIPKPTHVDNSVFGIVPLAAYLQNKDPRFLQLGLSFADEQFKKLTDAELAKLTPEVKGWYTFGLSWQTRLWIDDMFMITALPSQAYKAIGDKKYIENAANEMVAYLDKLQKENGLFYHLPDVPFYWGRGDGWMAVGMADLLKNLPSDNPYRKRIMEDYVKMMQSLLKYQDPNGMWHQLIDDPEAWPETSCTSMFTYAIIIAVKNGWLDAKTYGPAARKAWIQLTTYLDENSEIKEVCEGTNKLNSHQYNIDRKRTTGDLHGQAPILWCANALLQ